MGRRSLFVRGGAATLIGDHSHVVTGTTPVVGAVLSNSGVFTHADSCDQLFGVAPWLVPLYFAFGVVAALLGEIAAGARPSSTAVP